MGTSRVLNGYWTGSGLILRAGGIMQRGVSAHGAKARMFLAQCVRALRSALMAVLGFVLQ